MFYSKNISDEDRHVVNQCIRSISLGEIEIEKGNNTGWSKLFDFIYRVEKRRKQNII